MKRYLKIWLLMTSNSIQSILATRFGILIFIFGKLARFGLFLGFIYFIFSGTKDILGYGRYQTLLFVLTFYFLGAAGQMLFREIYRLRGKVVSGNFDFDLVKPVHPLLKNLAGGFDLMDLITLPVFVWALFMVIQNLSFKPMGLVLYLILSVNGLLIMAAVHILVAGFGVITTEVDHAVLVYRDLESMGRFPIDIYREPLREILTFVVPVGLMFTIPAKAFLGLLSWSSVFGAIIIGILSLYLSFKFWDFALLKYSSASS